MLQKIKFRNHLHAFMMYTYFILLEKRPKESPVLQSMNKSNEYMIITKGTMIVLNNIGIGYLL